MWIEQHYAELLKVAKRRDGIEPADILQTAVLQVLTAGSYERTDVPWPWMVEAIRGVAANARRSGKRRKVLRRDLKILLDAGLSLGWKQPAPGSDNPGGDR
jgi:DNA-directed RNA polymerase specialized sigma24 family protein